MNKTLNSFKNLKDSSKRAKDLCIGDFFNYWDAPNDDNLLAYNPERIEQVKEIEANPHDYPEWQEVIKVTNKKVIDEKLLHSLLDHLYDNHGEIELSEIELSSGKTMTVYALDEFNIKVHEKL